jgi:PAS domain S-box-containing protein
LRPSQKSTWFIFGAASLLSAMIAVDVVAGSPPATSILISDLFQTLVAFLAATSTFVLAKRSSSYMRQLWTLFSAALFLSVAAQGLETYYQNFVHASSLTPWPSDVLYILWVTPAVMLLLPRPPQDSEGIDWLQVLDFAQIGVVALTAYLYFYYVPSRWEVEGARMVSKLIELQMFRDIALTLGFLIRAGAISKGPVRAFFERVASIFFVSAATAGLYISTPFTARQGAQWSDVVWCAPYVLTAFVAAMWNREEEQVVLKESSRFRAIVLSQVLPIFIPLMVLFMGHRIAAEQLTLAWIAVTASFILSAARLVLTNEEQRRIADHLRETESALSRSERMFLTAFRSGPDSAGISTMDGGRFLDVNDGFIRLTGYTRQEALSKSAVELNLWKDPARRAEIIGKLKKESEVHNEEFVCITKRGEERICQFSGTLLEVDGQLCALTIVRDVTSHKLAEDALRASEERFRTLVQDFHVGVVVLGPHAEVQFANRAAEQMFGITLEEARGKDSSKLDLITMREDGTEIPFSQRIGPRAIASGKAIHSSVNGWRHKGSSETLWTFGTAVPQFGPDGKLSAVIGTFTNVTELKHAEKALHQLSTRLLQLQDDERRRLGRELHDSLAQSVLAVNLNLAQLSRVAASLDERSKRALKEGRRLLSEMSREIRTLSYLLHPPLLDELGLVSAVKEYAEGFSERSGIQMELDIQAGFSRLPQEEETALFRVVQESLSNIQRHSGTKTAKLSLRVDSANVSLEVSDRGRGMDLQNIENGNGSGARLGVGILGMRERMAQLGGTLDIESSSSGTTVRVSIPSRIEVANAGSNPRSR